MVRREGDKGHGPHIPCSDPVYDSSGHLVTVKTPSGQEKKFAYDSSGHLTGITDADGAQNTYTYDL